MIDLNKLKKGDKIYYFLSSLGVMEINTFVEEIDSSLCKYRFTSENGSIRDCTAKFIEKFSSSYEEAIAKNYAISHKELEKTITKQKKELKKTENEIKTLIEESEFYRNKFPELFI